MTTEIVQKSYVRHARDLLILGIPLMIMQVMQFGLHVTDVLMVGRFSVEAGAALVLVSGYWFIVFILLAGASFAVMPLVATAQAEGDTTTIRRATRMSVWLAVFFAISAFPLFYFSDVILIAMGQDPQLVNMAYPYAILVGIELLPGLAVAGLRFYFAALERTGILLAVGIASLGLNVMINDVLIYGKLGFPELGITGAGVASLVVTSLSLVAICLYAHLKTPENELFKNPFKADWPMCGKLLKLGVPIGFTNLAEVSLFNLAAIMMGWIGTAALASHGFALQLAALAFMIQLGLAQAGTIHAGTALGKKDETYLRRDGITLSVLSAGVAVVCTILFLIVPEPLLGLFMSEDDPQRAEVLALGVSLMFLAGIMQLSDGGQAIMLSLLRGLQDTVVPFWMAAFSYWVIGLSTSYILGFVLGWGPQGIWIGFITGLTAAWALLSGRFWLYKVKIAS